MPITKDSQGTITYTNKEDAWDSTATGVYADNDFAVANKAQPLKQVKFDVLSSNQADAVVTFEINADTDQSINLSDIASGVFETSTIDTGSSGMDVVVTNETATTGSQTVRGIVGEAYAIVDATKTNSGSVIGLAASAGRVDGSDAGTLTNIRGISSSVQHDCAGTTTNIIGVRVVPTITSGTVTNLYDFQANTGTNTGTVTNVFGLHISPAASGTKNSWIAQNTVLGGTTYSAPTGALDVNDDHIRVRTAKTPASAAAAGNAGDIAWDADFIYVCIATNSWTRAAIAAW